MTDNKLIAEIQPLDGKHYGTIVSLYIGQKWFDINVWIPLGLPSEESCIKAWDVTQDQWEANIEIDDGWGGKLSIQSEFPCDNHYQSEIEKIIAERIQYALNGLQLSKEVRRG